MKKSTQIFASESFQSEILNGIEVPQEAFMAEKRYSRDTIETYISLVELFFKYF